MCQLSLDVKFGNSFDVKKMAMRIFVAIFKSQQGQNTKIQEFINRIRWLKIIAVNTIFV